MALESEIDRWKGFANALRMDDKEAFDQLMDMCMDHASAGGCACNPILFEPMMMSILLSMRKELTHVKKELNVLRKKEGNPEQPQGEGSRGQNSGTQG